MHKTKKGAMELSIGAIVILIIAITFLSLALIFVRGMLGKMFMRFDEQISQEPEPPKPTLSFPITLSRNPIKSKEDTVEVIKISIMNPSQKDWINRQFIKTENMCGKVDGICFIDVDDTTGMCNTESNAEDNDPDCVTGLFIGMNCEDNAEKSPCLISNIYNEDEPGGGPMFCPMEPGTLPDPNCNPEEGVEVYLNCDETIMKKPFKRTIDPIYTNEFVTNILLLRLKGKIPDDQYLCQLRIFAEDMEYMEDLVVRIENE